MKLFSIRDNKVGCYHLPRPYKHEAEAIRGIQMETQNEDSMLKKFPNDYSLFLIGSWDETTGLVNSFDAPHHIGIVSDLAPIQK